MSYQDPAPDDGAGVATVAKEQAGQVGQTAAQAGGQVAQTTKEQAQNVVGEAKQQARDLVGEARSQVSTQAGTQKTRAVEGLRTVGDELQQMASQGGQSGMATEVARQAAERVQGLAEYIDRHEPAELLDQFRSYARRRPVVFLTGAALAGVLAGRLTRNLASKDDGGSDRRFTSSNPPALPAGNTYDAGYTGTGYVQTGYEQPGYTQPGYAETGYAQTGYTEPAPSLAVPPNPAYPGGGVESVGYDQPGGAYEPEPGTAYDPEPGSAYRPDSEQRDWRAP